MESGRKPSNSHTITFSGYSWQNLLGPNVILCSNSLQSEHKQHCNIYHSQHQFINTIHTASSLYLCTLTAQASLHLKTSSLTHHDPHSITSSGTTSLTIQALPLRPTNQFSRSFASSPHPALPGQITIHFSKRSAILTSSTRTKVQTTIYIANA
jgi:hypothetical protein